MIVNVAGAGAGKTTQMANLITRDYIPEGKIVFCIAFTNAAAENIEKKLIKKLGAIPSNIKISTIHSFLYQELISPYYYLLYGKHFDRLSVIDLPTDVRYRKAKLSELENDNILHITKIPEKAKWVAYKKSGDRRAIKNVRERILKRFSDYCAAIFVDEAQDISGDVKTILEALEKSGVHIILYGDPKQDVKGQGCFREIIAYSDDVTYIPDCYRCPQKHLDLSNTLAPTSERQIADAKNAAGSISVVFESDIEDIKQFVSDGNYGLQYISKKIDRFDTHEKNEKDGRFETLRHEVHRAMVEKWSGLKTDIEVNRAAFYVTEQMLDNYNGSNEARIISHWVNLNVFDRPNGKRYAQMSSALQTNGDITTDVPVVRSIEIVKGLEAERCLFILTTDLAPYLFRRKTTDNKTSHLLYVALTRSLDHLTILITREVED